MPVLECRKLYFQQKNAPLASQDSIPSLPAKSRERLSVSTKPANTIPRIVQPKSPHRPSSEGMFDDGIPKLPPKKVKHK